MTSTSPAASAQPVAPAPKSSARVPAFDTIRAIAAVIVVVHHVLLVSPSFQRWQFPTWFRPVMHSPLAVFFDGAGAVWVFFVLSGVVAMLAYRRSRPISRGRQMAQRFARLYIPSAISVFPALILWAVCRGIEVPHQSSWVKGHNHMDIVDSTWHSLTLLGGVGFLNSSLWSLQWELWFVLLAPVFTWLVVVTRKVWPLTACAAMAVTFWAMMQGYDQWHQGARYLPLFVAGMVIGDQIHVLSAWGRRCPGWIRLALGCASIVLLSIPHLFRTVLPNWQNPSGWACIGAASLVAVVAMCQPGELTPGRLLSWVATRSFSLYLVHEPIVIATSNLLHTARPQYVGLVAIPASFAAATVFFRYVEGPAHRLARRIATPRRDVGTTTPTPLS